MGILPIVPASPPHRDFFLLPGRPRLTGAYADDRVLVFARDAGSLYVSWDLSESTFGAGPGAELVVVDLRSQQLHAQPVSDRVGARFPVVDSPGAKVRVELRRGPSVLARSRWLRLPGQVAPAPPTETSAPKRMRVAPKARLPVRRLEPVPEGWAEASAAVAPGSARVPAAPAPARGRPSSRV